MVRRRAHSEPSVRGLRRRHRVRARNRGASGSLIVRIGPVEADSPFLLAPLAGVSDSPFRQLAREQGASIVYTEMVSADGLARGQQATLDYCAFETIER